MSSSVYMTKAEKQAVNLVKNTVLSPRFLEIQNIADKHYHHRGIESQLCTLIVDLISFNVQSETSTQGKYPHKKIQKFLESGIPKPVFKGYVDTQKTDSIIHYISDLYNEVIHVKNGKYIVYTKRAEDLDFFDESTNTQVEFTKIKYAFEGIF